MEGKYTAMQVADWFLLRNRMAIADVDAEYISNMKLQKLLYYAQGIYLAITGTPLFDDPIVAWTHGPVVESVYHKYKPYGSNGINQDGYDQHEFDDEAKSILDQVYEVFGQYAAWKLREMSHDETPWQTAKQGCVIEIDKIKDYFLENYIDE